MDKYKKLAQKFADKEKIVATTITLLKSPVLLECMYRESLDFLLFDTEHGIFDTEKLVDLLQICRLMELPSCVRVQDSEYHLIAKVIDMGADGIMIPRVERMEQMKTAVDALLFYPDGRKGIGGHGQLRKGEKFSEFKKTRFLLPQIESPKGIKLLPEMLERYDEYISAVIIGPNDLSIMLGTPLDTNSPVVMKEIQKVIDICNKYDKSCGIFCDNENTAKMFRTMGCNVLWTGLDKDLFLKAYTGMMDVLDKIE